MHATLLRLFEEVFARDNFLSRLQMSACKLDAEKICNPSRSDVNLLCSIGQLNFGKSPECTTLKLIYVLLIGDILSVQSTRLMYTFRFCQYIRRFNSITRVQDLHFSALRAIERITWLEGVNSHYMKRDTKQPS